MKYRLWSEEEGKWLEPGCGTHCYHFYGISLEGKALYLEGALSNEEVTCEEIEAVIQRATGILDKNGKEIYEGDIVHVICTAAPDAFYAKPHNRIVVSIKGRLNIIDTDVWCLHETYEIIGNIFENSDLK